MKRIFQIIYSSLLVIISLSSFYQGVDVKESQFVFLHTPFPQVISAIESQTNYHIFYDPALLDTFKITIISNGKNISWLLDSILKKTDFKFTIDQNSVFITKGKSVETDISDVIFDENAERVR